SSWTDAEAEAVQLGGHLATVRNQAENNWIYSSFSQYGETGRGLWIGLNDAAVEGTFVWASGEDAAFRNWGTGEPNNNGAGEDFVHLFWPADSRHSKWNDSPDGGFGPVPGFWSGIPLDGVVEVIPPTTTDDGDPNYVSTGSGWRLGGQTGGFQNDYQYAE